VARAGGGLEGQDARGASRGSEGEVGGREGGHTQEREDRQARPQAQKGGTQGREKHWGEGARSGEGPHLNRGKTMERRGHILGRVRTLEGGTLEGVGTV